MISFSKVMLSLNTVSKYLGSCCGNEAVCVIATPCMDHANMIPLFHWISLTGVDYNNDNQKS